MALEKATIDILAGAHAGERITVLFNPFEYTIERANTFKATRDPGPERTAPPVHQRRSGRALDGAVPRRLHRPQSGREERRGAADRDHGSPGDRSPSCTRRRRCGSSGESSTSRQSSRRSRARSRSFSRKARRRARRSTVSFKEYKTLPELIRDPPLQSADKSKRRVIVGLDSLWAMAAREYGDAALWRVIAAHNDLDDPRDVGPGDWVMVPPLENVDGSRGLL